MSLILSVSSGLVCERKVSRLKARKQGFYIRLVYALLEGDEKTVTKAKVLAELRAIKIAC